MYLRMCVAKYMYYTFFLSYWCGSHLRAATCTSLLSQNLAIGQCLQRTTRTHIHSFNNKSICIMCMCILVCIYVAANPLPRGEISRVALVAMSWQRHVVEGSGTWMCGEILRKYSISFAEFCIYILFEVQLLIE